MRLSRSSERRPRYQMSDTASGVEGNVAASVLRACVCLRHRAAVVGGLGTQVGAPARVPPVPIGTRRLWQRKAHELHAARRLHVRSIVPVACCVTILGMPVSGMPTTSTDPRASLLGLSWKFVVHVGIGSLLFASIVFAVVQLSHVVAWMESQGVSPWAVELTRGMEYLVFFVDAVLFTIFLGRTAWVFGRSMLTAEIAS